MPGRRGVAKFAYGFLSFLLALVLIISVFVGPGLFSTFSSVFTSIDGGLLSEQGTQVNVSTAGYSLLYYDAPKPQNYQILAQYVLNLINNDRIYNNVSGNVTLDYNAAAQQHAYSMLTNDYFSHWDTQGYKPYMRYTIAGGIGSVEENVAFEGSPNTYTSVSAVETALSDMEYQMVYNDAAHDNGHRYNILDPYHNMVSIGIAYDKNIVYLVQDFENKYITWSQAPALATDGEVDLEGAFNLSQKIGIVQVYYDPLPQDLTTTQLGGPPYGGSYSPGTFVAGVLPAGYEVSNGTTITASTWDLQPNLFVIKFSMASVLQKYGPGVYTIYVSFPPSGQSQESFSSISLFVTNSST